MKSKKLKLIECYGRCLDLENKIELKMQQLSRNATEIYGEELRADMCEGDEIEFRTLDEDGYVNADSVILIEDIIKKEEMKQLHNNTRN